MKRFPCNIQDGTLIMTDLIEFKTYLKTVTGKREFIIGTAGEMRSVQSNKYLHLVCGLIGKHTGESVDEVKLQMKYDLGMFEVFEYNGKQLINWRSTAKMSQEEFSIFTEHMLQRADWLGVQVLSPEDYFEMVNSGKTEIDFAKLTRPA